jgi:hypothetical protein
MHVDHSQLQVLVGGLRGCPTNPDLGVVLSALQNTGTVLSNGSLLQLLPQASSTDAMPLVLQIPGPADQGMHMLPGGATLSSGVQLVGPIQPLQQVCIPQGYIQAPGQQLVRVEGTSQLAACAGTGVSNAMQVQMQQLNSQTAVAHQLLLSTQASTAQGSVAAGGASNIMVSMLGHWVCLDCCRCRPAELNSKKPAYGCVVQDKCLSYPQAVVRQCLADTACLVVPGCASNHLCCRLP